MAIIINLIFLYVMYQCFENDNVKLSYLITFIIYFLEFSIKSGGRFLGTGILISLIYSLIENAFGHFIYERTNSFFTFLLIQILIVLLISFGVPFILGLFLKGAL